jgi:hypothetical protein
MRRMQMQQVKRADALTKVQFHERLRTWFSSTDDHVVKADVPGVTPWVHIRDGADMFVLHADTRRDAVGRYLELVSRYGNDLEWTITASQRGNPTAVLYGPEKVQEKSFYLYRPR